VVAEPFDRKEAARAMIRWREAVLLILAVALGWYGLMLSPASRGSFDQGVADRARMGREAMTAAATAAERAVRGR